MKLREGRIAITFACIVLGLMLAVQYKSTQGLYSPVNTQRAEELAIKVKELEAQNKALSSQMGDKGGHDKQIEEIKYAAGLSEVTGTGIIITVDDSREPVKPGSNANLYIIHDEDLLRIVNELRAAGAEAISINGQRLVSMSEIRCVGPVIHVNGKPLSPPFEIKVIGSQKALESALNIRGGIKESLKYWGINVQIKKENNINIPAFDGTFRHEFVESSSEGE